MTLIERALVRDVERIKTTIGAKERRGQVVPESFRESLRAAEDRLREHREAAAGMSEQEQRRPTVDVGLSSSVEVRLAEGIALTKGLLKACRDTGSPTVPTPVAAAINALRNWADPRLCVHCGELVTDGCDEHAECAERAKNRREERLA